MPNRNQIDLVPIVHRLVSKALADEYYDSVFDDLCNALVDAGLPLLRANLGMEILHPLVSSVDITWSREHGFEVNPRDHTSSPLQIWLESPFHWMLTNKCRELRQKLDDLDGEHNFAVFDDFRSQGATDYVALMTGFGDPQTAFERRDGIFTSWVSDAPDGFSDHQLDTLKKLQPYIGLVAKLSKYEYTSRNVMAAYLGEDAGRRVLEGQIRLGDVEHIPAVIWYSDLRDSTTMAERLPIETFLQTVNAYFDCTAGAVMENGGEVLRFIGDAVLAVFPMTTNESPEAAARQALRASEQSRARLSALNQRRAEDSQEQIAFGLGLHLGELLYGNIGVPSRIEFSVIGRAANEVSRLESLTKEVGEPVLVSRAFRDVIDLPWRDLGTYAVKGVAEEMELYAPPLSPFELARQRAGPGGG